MVATLRRYHRGVLDAHGVVVNPPAGEPLDGAVSVRADDDMLVRWLSGRAGLPVTALAGDRAGVEAVLREQLAI